MLSTTDLGVIDALHGGFPLVPRPFARVGTTLAMSEDDLMDVVRRLLLEGDLTRFGPLFQIERAGGRFVLAALQVPEARFEDVASIVNAQPEVAHNYRRDHRLNMWCVVATESHALADQALARIGQLTGLEVLAFPKEREYFVELRLPILSSASLASDVTASHTARQNSLPSADIRQGFGTGPAQLSDSKTCAEKSGERRLSTFERQLLQATQAGLPITPQPYAVLAHELGVTQGDVIQGLSTLLSDGVIRRIGAVPHHYRLGFVANGMSVWDVDDDQVDALGEAVGRLPGVSHCYRRPRHGTAWPYNLFAMLHGRSREEVQVQAAHLRDLLGPACRTNDILYSSAVLKKTGLRLRTASNPTVETVVTAVEG